VTAVGVTLVLRPGVTLFSVLLVGLVLASPVMAEYAWVLWAEQKRATRGGAYENSLSQNLCGPQMTSE
jgi:hypothetical protein